ncbi:outer dynein arm-docking complex subunit 4-like [Leptopilina heterotoma]|uniref:outer dynein arm-docking complex subunit 4-like n=1 Tax=Leptopilina heterotoma TaxID=63436 RepID=UPI001CA82EBE|nr:outer dynein arm-docking complex subunit 4-like [Leptopilina heterotoma]
MSAIAKVEKSAQHVERGRKSFKHLHGNDRHYAKLLHREADQYYLREDYEMALNLHHKAVNMYPSDNSSHSVAVRGTTSAVSSTVANPSSSSSLALRKLLPKAQNGVKLSTTLSTPLAGIENIVKQSTNPSRDFPEILHIERFLDRRERIKKLSSSMSSDMVQRVSRTQMMQRQLLFQANTSLTNLKEHFIAGDVDSTLKLAREIIFLSSGLELPYRYQVEAYSCLALINVSQRRHDRAVNNVSQMINAARASGNTALFTKSLVILGVVHISFDHYDALSRAWNFLLPEVNDLVPRAWIHHEIGRCHFECQRYSQSLQLSIECQKLSLLSNSKKWFRYGQLLTGQSLLKLGRFEDGLKTLKLVGIITEEVGDTTTLEYIRSLINQVSGILTQGSGEMANVVSSIDSSREKKILKDRQSFREFSSSADKTFDNEISSIKIDNIEDHHSITTSDHIVNEDCDLDSITSRDSDKTYVIRKDQYQILGENSPREIPSPSSSLDPFHSSHSHGDFFFQHNTLQNDILSAMIENQNDGFDIDDSIAIEEILVDKSIVTNKNVVEKNDQSSFSSYSKFQYNKEARKNISKNSITSIFPDEQKLLLIDKNWRLFLENKN